MSAGQKVKQLADSRAMEAETPTIAWNRLSVMDAMELAELNNVQGELRILAALLDQGKLTQGQIDRLLEMNSMDYQRSMIQEQMEAMAKYVTYVPRSWFVDAAPETLDFGDAETYKHLRRNRYGELYRMLTGTAPTEDLTGN